jgi:hypothetical protein
MYARSRLCAIAVLFSLTACGSFIHLHHQPRSRGPSHPSIVMDAQDNINSLQARLAVLIGPEHRMKRKRIRQRLAKLTGESEASRDTAKAPDQTIKPRTRSTLRSRARRSRSPTRASSPGREWRPRGAVPNIEWRAISMDELRAHPFFIELPEAHTVVATTPADFRLFRQDSRQWWACHAGRITTSACASCLGVYEERSAAFLGVPPSLRGHGKALDAHARLTTPALTSYTQEHAPPNGGNSSAVDGASIWRLGVWSDEPCDATGAPPPGKGGEGAEEKAPPRFLLEYHGDTTATPPSGVSEDALLRPPSVSRVRMAWGSAQEATSILAALNHFGAMGAIVEEAGLYALEAVGTSDLPGRLPPIGASPDAVIRWPDRRVEPLEVKNHAPFRRRHSFAGARAGDSMPFEVSDPGPFDEVATWHVPQLYLHMLCLGASCRSCLFISMSATRGANIFRLHRDDELMGRILQFVERFTIEYGGGQPPPEADYFWGRPGYEELLARIKTASEADVELVARVSDRQLQRAGSRKKVPFFWA